MNDAILLRTADRNLRRKYASDIPGLTAFADKIAGETKASAVTITSSVLDGSSGAGQVTMPREVWLTAAEELLADPVFNASAAPRPPRCILPDYRLAAQI